MNGVAIHTLGCKVNQVESEQIAGELASRFSLPADQPYAVVINTCAVTGEAEAKTRKAIRRAAAEPNVLVVAVTGCAASVSGEALASLDPKVLVVTDKGAVAEAVEEFLAARGIELAEGTGLAEHHRTRRAVKVQDGCENFCSYCIVPYARGAGSSTPLDEVVGIVRALVAEGVGEVVLTGINIGKYRDRASGGSLADLVTAIRSTGLHRLRLSSIEPPDVTDALLSALSVGGFGCEHLHIPLQSGSDNTLGAMSRRYTVTEFEETVARVRKVWPNVAITTDVIVGFPGETDDDFEATLAVCRRIGFSRIHVFRFSPRSGTPAAEMAMVDPRVASARAEALRELADELAANYAQTHAGADLEVVVERSVAGVAHVTSREYMHFAVPEGAFADIAGPLVEGAILRVAYDRLSRNTVGLE